MTDQPTQPDRRGLIGWIITHPKSTLALSILLMAALAILGLSHTAESRLAAKIAAIKAKGEPTTIQDLLACQRQLPDDQNRFAAICRIAQQLDSLRRTDQELKRLYYAGPPEHPPTGERWTDNDIQAARTYLKKIEPQIRALHAALKVIDSYAAVPWTSPAFSAHTPGLVESVIPARALAMDALTTSMTVNRDAAERLMVESSVMFRFCEGEGGLYFIQYHINRMMADAVERIINDGGLSDSTLRELDRALLDTEANFDTCARMVVDRVVFLDSITWLRNRARRTWPFGSTAHLGKYSYAAYWTHIPALPAVDIADGLDYYAAAIDAARTPEGQRIQRMLAYEAGHDSTWLNRMSTSMNYRHSESFALMAGALGEMRALRIAIAAERFRMSYGKWPESLAALVPGYVESVPSDPVDGRPIRYEVIPEGIKTWTIFDGDKNCDDGGDLLRLMRTKPWERGKDIGWVILNPDLRCRACNPPSTTTAPLSTTQPRS
ncbi:MAG: hypothetical protein HZA51_10240 [Planctomycetes bacterium]|nr:hypothetical protein [Planctomycetota bacterium]